MSIGSHGVSFGSSNETAILYVTALSKTEVRTSVISWKNTTKTTIITEKYTTKITGGATVIVEKEQTSILLNGSSSQTLQITPKDKDDCLADIMKCAGGFTLSMKMKFHSFKEGCIMGNGGNSISKYGISFLREFGMFHMVVRTKTQEWVSSFRSVQLQKWHTFDLSFSLGDGVSTYVDNSLVGRTRKYVRRSMRRSMTSMTQSSTTYVGSCSSSSSSVSTEQSKIEISTITTYKETRETLVKMGIKIIDGKHW